MTARTIKTREEIQRTLDNLQKDLYFSFGVPEQSGMGVPDDDPRVSVDLSHSRENLKAIQWANDVAACMDGLQGSFAVENKKMPHPKHPQRSESRRFVSASSPNHG